MPSPPYHGGHSLADLVYELLRFRSLREGQEELAQRIADREIVLSRELPPDWYLEWVSLHEKGDGWARFGGRRIMIMAAGKPIDPREIRWHEPPLPVRPEQIFKEEPPPPDPDPPVIAAAEESAIPASLPPEFAGNGGHSLAVILKGWRRGHSLPIVQEYLVALKVSGDITLSEDLPDGWWLEDDPVIKSIIIATVNGCLYTSEIRCLFPNDARLTGSLQLSRLQKPAVRKEQPRENADPPLEQPAAPAAPVTPTEPMTATPATTVGKEPLEAKPTKPMTRREAELETLRQLIAEAALWLAPQLNEKSKVDDFKDDCLKEFPDLAPSTYDKRVWPAARILRGWSPQAPPGAKGN